MTPLVSVVTKILATGVLVGDIAIACVILFFLSTYIFSSAKKSWKEFVNMVGPYMMHKAFVFALIATLGSLFYSIIAGYTPCNLCWFQRIFVYPQVIILGLALWKKDLRNIVDYSLTLGIIGAAIAAYHYYGQMFNTSSLPCSATAVSCAQRFFASYGYITLPMMSLTASLLIIVCTLMYRSYQKSK